MTTSLAIDAASGPRLDASLSVTVVADDAITTRRVAAALAAGGIGVRDSWPLHQDLIAGAPASDVVVLACDSTRPANVSALRRLRSEVGGAGIVVVATGSRSPSARQALNTGADAFVLEAELEPALAPVVRAVAAGQISVPRAMRRCVVRPALSHRERQVLALVVRGLQNREIADRLFLAESTIKSHLGSSFEKLGVTSRKEAAALLLDPDEGLRALVMDEALDGSPTPQ
jgi:DNA-binding NarL/FixJ family response regulator